MAQEVTIDACGRLVIPKRVRQRHRLSAGTRLTLVEDGDRIVLVPRPSEASVVEKNGVLVFTGRLPDTLPDHRDSRRSRLARLSGPS